MANKPWEKKPPRKKRRRKGPRKRKRPRPKPQKKKPPRGPPGSNKPPTANLRKKDLPSNKKKKLLRRLIAVMVVTGILTLGSMIYFIFNYVI